MAAHGAPVPSSDGMQPTCAQDALNAPAAQHSAPASPQTCTEPRVAPPHSIAASASHAGSPIQEQRRALGFRESELVESVVVPSRPSGHSADLFADLPAFQTIYNQGTASPGRIRTVPACMGSARVTVRLGDERYQHGEGSSISGSSLESVKSGDYGTLDANSASTPRRSSAWADGSWKLYSGLQSVSHGHETVLNDVALTEVQPNQSVKCTVAHRGPHAGSAPASQCSPRIASMLHGGREACNVGAPPFAPFLAMQGGKAVRADISELAQSQLKTSSTEEGDNTSLVSHSHVIDTMRTHHQVLLDQAEMHSKQALLELKGKTEDVQGLQTRVDGDLAEVKQACNRILNQLDGPVPSSPPPAKARSLVGRVVLVPPLSLGWLSKGSAALWQRRSRCYCALLCFVFLATFALAATLLATLLSRASGALIQDAVVQAVHAPAAPSTAGRVMLDVTVALSAPGTVWYAVFEADAAHVDAKDVVRASSAANSLQPATAPSACGKLFVPMLRSNHTFTIAGAALSSECGSAASGRAVSPELQNNCLRCPELQAQTHVKVFIVTKSKGKLDMAVREVTTSDAHPATFQQPPKAWAQRRQGLGGAMDESIMLRIAVSEDVELHWVMAYEHIAAEFRRQQLNYTSSGLSTAQVVSIAESDAVSAAGRSLRQSASLDLEGPVAGFGTMAVSHASGVHDVVLDTPCLLSKGMCAHHEDAVNPSTAYKIYLVLVDEAGNQMRTPVTVPVTSSFDQEPPHLCVRDPLDATGSQARSSPAADCHCESGVKVCSGVGTRNITLYFQSNEAGAVYYRLDKLPSASLCNCEALDVVPGGIYEVPLDQQWRNCQPVAELADPRRMLATEQQLVSGVRGRSFTSARHVPDMHVNLLGPHRTLMQSVLNSAMCPSDCQCCQQDHNCRLSSDAVWTPHMHNVVAPLMSTCAYMDASIVLRMPISDASREANASVQILAAAQQEPGSPAALALPDAAQTASAAVNRSEDAPALMAETPVSRTLRSQAQIPSMRIEPGSETKDPSAAEFRHQFFMSPSAFTLEPNSFYELRVVGEDQAWDSGPNVRTPPQHWIFRTQAETAPECSLECDDVSADSFSISGTLNLPGKLHYIVQEFGGHAVPTVENVFQGSTGAVVGPIHHGTVVTTANLTSDCSRHSGAATITGLQTDGTYIVYAIAEDLNWPQPNRMTEFCSPNPLICRPCDDPFIKVLQVACECQGHAQVQVTLQAGRARSDAADRGREGVHVHYMVLEAKLPSSAAPFDSAAFPAPTAGQVRQGHVRDTTPTAVVPVADALCVSNDINTTFTVPGDSSSVRLSMNQDYIVCVAPPASECADASQSMDEPATCQHFSTHRDSVPLSCSMSDCTCTTSERCSAQLTCSSPLPDEPADAMFTAAALATTDQAGCSSPSASAAPALLRYRVGPSDCGGLRGLTCLDFFSGRSIPGSPHCPPAEHDCCPNMDNDLLWRLDCCAALAYDEVQILPDTSVKIELPDMASCGDIDVIACAARTPCQRCPCSQACTPPSLFCEQDVCASTPLQYVPTSNGTCVLSDAQAPGTPPLATSYSDPQLFVNRKCGDDQCAPGICEVTICQPDGTCAAGPISGPLITPAEVFAIGDSPGTMCCLALPFTAEVPTAGTVMAGGAFESGAGTAHGCSSSDSARTWHTIELPGLDDGLYRAHCSANDTNGNILGEVQSVLLSGPRIIEPSCVLRPGCTASSRTAKLSLSLTVAGTISYVLVETAPPFLPQLNVSEVFNEAAQPDRLRPFMESGISASHPTHHGVLEVLEPAANVQVPIVITPGAQYQLVIAARASTSVPCCFDALGDVQTFPISDGECSTSDCSDRNQILAELRPDIRVSGSSVFPVCKKSRLVGPIGSGRSCETVLPIDRHGRLAFEQDVAFLGVAAASVIATATVGSQPLFDSRNPASRQAVTIALSANKRAPAAAALAVQQQSVFEGERIDGSAREGTIYIRYMLMDAFNSTAVSLDGVQRQVLVRTPSGSSLQACADEYDAFSGGGCEVTIPRGAFAAEQSVQAQISLQLAPVSPGHTSMTSANNSRIVSNSASVTLVGKAVASSLVQGSAVAVAPARHLHSGEHFTVSAYMQLNAGSVSGAVLRWHFDPSVLSFMRIEYPAGWTEEDIQLTPSAQPDTVIVRASASATGTGARLPLPSLVLKALPALETGTYREAVVLSSSSRVTSASQLTNLLTGGVTHLDYSGVSSEGAAIQIKEPRARDLLIGTEQALFFDLTPAQAEPLQALIKPYLLVDHPFGSAGLQLLAPQHPGYRCQSPQAGSVRKVAAGCDVALPKTEANAARWDRIDISTTVAGLAAQTSVSVLRPRYQVEIEDHVFRRLGSVACESSTYETAAVTASAAFVDPDAYEQELRVDLTTVADLRVEPRDAAEVRNGLLTPLRAVASASVTVRAAASADDGSGLPSASFEVLDEPAAIEALMSVVVSEASLSVADVTPTQASVQLHVEQTLTDPGDTGVVAVYAQRISSFNRFISTDVTKLVSVINITDALSVEMDGAGTHTAVLSNDITAINCDRHLVATWQACDDTLCGGASCVCVAPPCPTAISGVAGDIACPGNVAAELLDLPSNVTLSLSLEYDDGQTRVARYPPPNNATLSLAVVAGSGACEVIYDGVAEPVVRARDAPSCGGELCRIEATYSDSCGGDSLVTTVDLYVMVAHCLQPGLGCSGATAFDFGVPDGTICDPIAPSLRSLQQLQCSEEGFAQRRVWAAALISERSGSPQGEFLDVTKQVTIAASDSSVITVTGSVPYLLKPANLGTATIAISVGSVGALSTAVPIEVSGSAPVSAFTLNEPQFGDDDVPADDPSRALCSRTFRGQADDTAPLTATFRWQDEECPIVSNLCDVPATCITLASSEPAAVTPSASCSMTLRDSSTFDVAITAAVDPAYSVIGPALSDTIEIFSNLEPEQYQLDLGHRCGAAFAVLDNGSQQPPRVAAAASAPTVLHVPVRLNVAGGEMLSYTATHTFDDTVLEPMGVHTQGCGSGTCAGLPSFYDANAGGLSGSNYGDTNAVHVNTVWRTGDGRLDGVHVVHTMCFQVIAAGDALLSTLMARIRYVGVSEADRLGNVRDRAANPNTIVLPSTPVFRRRLRDSDAAGGLGSDAIHFGAAQGRTLQQVAADPTSFDWLDIQRDGLVDTMDSDIYFRLIESWSTAGSEPQKQQFCAWLDRLYNPSSADERLDESFVDSSIVDIDSFAWQAVDPKVITLRTTDSVYLRHDSPTPCPDSALQSAQQLPLLARFDGTAPPTRQQFYYLTGQSSEPGYNDLMHPNLEAFKAYQAAMLGNTAFLSSATVGEIDSDVTELVLTIRNDVILPDGTQRRFLTSATQVYVELLPLTPSDTVFERLADAEDMEFAHDVWPPKLTVASYAADRDGWAAKKSAPVSIMTAYKSSTDGSTLFVTHAIQAERVMLGTDEATADFRIAIKNSSLRRTRKMAVGVTLVTAAQTTDRVQHVNSYYQSALFADQSPGCLPPAAPQFVPYAIMELGCKSLPYTPHVFFVSETGAKPAAGMDFDAENGVTVLVVVEADAEFAFDEPVQWAAILDTEYQAKRASGSKTFSALQHEFFNSSYSGTSSSQSTTSTDCEEWCFLRQGSFDQRGKPSQVVLDAVDHNFPDDVDRLMFGFVHGLRPGQRTHILLAPGGCNTTVIQNIIVPDFLPPSFTGLKRTGASTLGSRGGEFEFDLHVRTNEPALVEFGIMAHAQGVLQTREEFDEVIDSGTFLAGDAAARAERCFDVLPDPSVPNYCSGAVRHYLESCFTWPGGSNRTSDGHKFPDRCPMGGTCMDSPPSTCPHLSAINCTGPDAGTLLHVDADLVRTVTLPADGFHCDCACEEEHPIVEQLGSVSVLLRAIDEAPNFQNLEPACNHADMQLVADDQVFVATCNSAIRPNVLDGVTPQRGEFVHLTLTWPPNPGNNDDVAQKLRENPGRSLVLTVQLPAQGIAWQPDHPKALADSDTWRQYGALNGPQPFVGFAAYKYRPDQGLVTLRDAFQPISSAFVILPLQTNTSHSEFNPSYPYPWYEHKVDRCKSDNKDVCADFWPWPSDLDGPFVAVSVAANDFGRVRERLNLASNDGAP